MTQTSRPQITKINGQNTKPHRLWLLGTVLVTGLLLAACETPAATAKDEATAKPDPRQGKEVGQLCFTGSINGFDVIDKKHVVLRKNVSSKFLVELTGICTNLSRAQAIKVDSNSSCLRRGDYLLVSDSVFFVDNAGGMGIESCPVRRIYEWNDKTNDPDSADKEEGDSAP